MNEWFHHPLFGIGLSVIAFSFAQQLQRKWSWLHPLFVCSGSIMIILLSFRIPFEAYKVGGDVITLFLGPATVALGVPLYKNAGLIRKHMMPILSGITVGSLTGIASAAVIVGLLGGTKEIIYSMMPKSVSAPIAVEISSHLGGIPELTVVMTVLTGLLGSMLGTTFLKWFGIKDDISIGIAIGTAAHGIGTARVIRDSELQGGLSGFAMGAAGILTSLLFIPVYYWLQ
ncbi:Inner membrane protein YohK [compost metagenome]